MFRRSKTRPRPPQSDSQGSPPQSPMRNAIERELGTKPPPKTEEVRPERKQARIDGASKRSALPSLKRTSKSTRPASPSPQQPLPFNTQNKATQSYETYTTKAKEAAIRGDIIQSEQYYQQADHYRRQMQKK